MELVRLKVEELTQEKFSPYGCVLDVGKLNPRMREDIFTFWDGLARMRVEGELTVGYLRVFKRPPEFSKLERHVKTEEIFFAIDKPVVALVGVPTPHQDHPDPSTVKAFYVKPGKGVLLKEGTWHWIPFPLEESADLLVLFKSGTVDNDLTIEDLAEKGVTFKIEI